MYLVRIGRSILCATILGVGHVSVMFRALQHRGKEVRLSVVPMSDLHQSGKVHRVVCFERLDLCIVQ